MNVRHLACCPLCGNSHLENLLTCTDHFATGESFAILTCTSCGFRMTQDVPVEAEIGRYYQSPDYISHSNTHQGLMNRVYHAVRSYMLNRKARLVEKCCGRTQGRLLDVGAGTGYFAHTMQQRGWQVEAVEKSAEAREFARQQFRLPVLDESRRDSFATGYFHAITLWHVMEHIEDLPALWRGLYRQLDRDGRLIVAVPNCASADACHYQQHWGAYDVPRHLWHFTPDTMVRMARHYGFELCGCHPMPFDAYYVSMLSEKYRGRKAYFWRGALRGLICGLQAMGHPERSSSLIYVFRKTK